MADDSKETKAVLKIQTSGTYGKSKVDRPKLDRVIVHTFVDAKCKLAVRINKLPLVPWPQYSLLSGTLMDDGRLMPFVQYRRDPSLASVNLEHDYAFILTRMTEEADKMIRDLMAADMKAYADSRYDKDHQRALQQFARGAKKAGTHNKLPTP